MKLGCFNYINLLLCYNSTVSWFVPASGSCSYSSSEGSYSSSEDSESESSITSFLRNPKTNSPFSSNKVICIPLNCNKQVWYSEFLGLKYKTNYLKSCGI